jgi:Bifunctional DNA primase/polymerase, N-terminal/Primase C terminal 1 (PriCT-1)
VSVLPPEILTAIARGWCLHPLKSRDKVPILKNWPALATSELTQVHRWNDQFPLCNWGIATGTKSGLFAVDCDGDAGLDWLKARIDGGDSLPESWAVKTPRGLHLYFSVPQDATIRSSASKIAPGVDIRGEGCFVAAPPSIHPSGKPYSIIDASCAVSPAPAWLLCATQSEVSEVKQRKPPQRFDILPEGQRNDGLTRFGGALRRKGHDQVEIEAELLKANIRRCQPPLPDAEVRKIAASVCRYEPGGPDPLEQAWQATVRDNSETHYQQFLRLAHSLQVLRPGLDIALPLERIAGLFGVHFTAVSQWRKKAVALGILVSTGQYIAHRRAGLYRLSEKL